MTPKEKAEELFDNFFQTAESLEWTKDQDVIDMTIEYNNRVLNEVNIYWKLLAKQCAVIAIDEIIEALDFDWMEVQNLDREHVYWNKVKEEIQNL